MELIQKTRNYTQEQISVIEENIKKNIILKATAGSGKTAVTTERIRYLIANGVPAERIIMFSYTVAACDEIKKRLNNDKVKVTTIHAFCQSMLTKMGKHKNIVDIFAFIEWYKLKTKPKPGSSSELRDHHYRATSKMYEDAMHIASEITAYKLQIADGQKCRLPKFMVEYWQFTKETKSRDFSDMLIEVNNLLKENKWLRLFKNQYDYIIVDEAQDTSTIQMRILLALNAKYYTLVLDKNQSIFAYSGANVDLIISMLKKRRDCLEKTLSMNFRSAKNIVEHANKYSDLTAIPYSQEEGVVHQDVILMEQLLPLLEKHEEVAILARTNSVIKDIEFELLQRKVPIRYFNYLNQKEIEELKKGTERPATAKKIKALLYTYKSAENIVNFIENNQDQKSFVSSIHKSKGKEWDVCVIVNCMSPELVEHNNIQLDEKQAKTLTFDPNNEEDFESQNVFYVACSRPKNEIYFMLHGI